MSFDKAISVSGLNKCFEIYDKPFDRLKQIVSRHKKKYYREFWALKNISFEVMRGETVGIVGKNGSGKSTLLQLICGTLNPTSGNIQIGVNSEGILNEDELTVAAVKKAHINFRPDKRLRNVLSSVSYTLS